MNHDVDDYPDGYCPPLLMPDLNHESKEESHPKIVSRFRSLFSQTPDFIEFDQPKPRPFSNQALLDIRKDAECSDSSFLDMTTSSNVTRRLLDVKRIFTNLATPISSSTRQHNLATHSRFESDGSQAVDSAATGSDCSDSQSHSTSSMFTAANTPPLTPDSCNNLVFSSPISSFSSEESGRRGQRDQEPQQQQYRDSHSNRIHIFGEGTEHLRHGSHLQEIKEGKRPERPIVCCLCMRLKN